MKRLLTVFFLTFAAVLSAQVVNEIAPDPSAKPAEERTTAKPAKNDISYSDSVVLGLVEGLTEYLPVSSTGHLILANSFLGLDDEEPLVDTNGDAILNKNFEPLTLKAAADAYAIVIQLGAIFAVAIIYWESLLKMLFGLIGKNPEGLRLLRNLIAAFLPAAIVGLFVHDFIERVLFGVIPVIAALFFGAVLMVVVQRRFDRANAFAYTKFTKLSDMKVRSALLVGILQCVAMWPGTSRSMMTIIGGYAAGLKPADSAKFSFLLGLITLSAASLFKIVKDGDAVLRAISVGPLCLGMFVAFVAAAVSVKWFVGFLTRRGLVPFAYYRILLAALLAGLLYFNLI